MSGTHKYPTISFRISPREREEIEAKIFVSGMRKKDYFVRSCIFHRQISGLLQNADPFYQQSVCSDECQKFRLSLWPLLSLRPLLLTQDKFV